MELRSPRNLSQRGRLGFLFKDTALYGGAAAISKAFSLITFPLLARHFSTADYGVIDFFGVLATFIGFLIIFGQDSAVARFFFEYEETEQRRRLISQSLIFQLLLCFFTVTVMLTWATSLSILLIDLPNAANLLSLIIIQAPFFVLLNFSQNLLKWTFQRNLFLLLSLGSTAVSVFLIVIGVYVFDIGVDGILWIGIINNAIFGLMGLWFVRSWLILPREFGFLKELVRYALPLGLICSIGAFVPAMERWLTADLLGFHDLGLYAAGTRVALLVSLFVNAFQTSWGPFSLSLYKQGDAILTYNRVLKLFILVMVPFAFLLGAIAHPLITALATDRYSSGTIVVFPLALGLVVQATSWITEIGVGISKRTYLNIYSYTAFIVSTLSGIFLFVYFFGLVGVALGVLLGHITKALFATGFAQKAYPMSWDYPVVSAFFLVSVLSGLAVMWIYSNVSAEFGSILFAIVGALLFVLGIFTLIDREERMNVYGLIVHRLNKVHR